MVHLVVDFDYVVAVFSSKEKANAYVARHPHYEYRVESHEVW